MKRSAILSAIGVLFLAIIFGVLISRKSVRSDKKPSTTSSRASRAGTLNAPLLPAIQTAALPLPSAPPYEATNALFRTPDRLWDEPIQEEAFARFHDWAENYLKTTASQKPALELEGLELAKSRREALRDLIQTDPQRALELTVPVSVRDAFPDLIANQLEERISQSGRLAVLGAFPQSPDQPGFVPVFRTASLGSGEFKTFVYGRRLGEPTRENIPVNGIAVDKLLAVSENPLRILEPPEAAAARAKNPDPICAISGQSAKINHDEVVAESGGQILFLCGKMHASQLNRQLTAAESGGDPGAAGRDREDKRDVAEDRRHTGAERVQHLHGGRVTEAVPVERPARDRPLHGHQAQSEEVRVAGHEAREVSLRRSVTGDHCREPEVRPVDVSIAVEIGAERRGPAAGNLD